LILLFDQLLQERLDFREIEQDLFEEECLQLLGIFARHRAFLQSDLNTSQGDFNASLANNNKVTTTSAQRPAQISGGNKYNMRNDTPRTAR